MSENGADRVRFVDLLRVVAAFQMVQGHTVDAVLSSAARTGALHAAWTATRGLTAVAFLFVAGVAFSLSTLRRFDAHRADARAVWRRVRHAGALVLLGYALHLPFAAWGAGAEEATLALARFVAVDVLQCIGVSLLLLEVLVVVLPTRRAFVCACAVLGVAMLVAAPAAHGLAPSGALAPFTHYLSPRGGSVFPLLPWSAHLLLGVAVGTWIDTPRPRVRAARLAILGACGLVCAGLARELEVAQVVVDHLGRLGWVMLAAAVIARVEHTLRTPAWAAQVARRTLLVYVAHVLFVYGDGVGLATLIGPTLEPGAALGVALVVVAGSFVLALVAPGDARRARLAAVATAG